MRILIEGRCLKNYLAKGHEAFRTGLDAMYDVRFFGKGYKGYSRLVHGYQDIVRRTYGDESLDVVIVEHRLPHIDKDLKYPDLASVDAVRSLVLSDYWYLERDNREGFVEMVLRNKIELILSLFAQPLDIWADTEIANRFVFLPFCFDPALFNDWQEPIRYDVGFLGAGTLQKSDFYPERFAIHNLLKGMDNIDYLWAPHPGWKDRRTHPFVGKNFSKLINSCRMFVTTGGVLRNCQPKIFEALASKTLVMSDEPVGADQIGLVDGVNYVQIDESSVVEKVRYYLDHEDEREAIAEAGYRLAMDRHNCFQRANDFYGFAKPLVTRRSSSQA